MFPPAPSPLFTPKGRLSLGSVSLIADYHEKKDTLKYGAAFLYPCFICSSVILPRLVEYLVKEGRANTRIILYVNVDLGHFSCFIFEKNSAKSYLFALDPLINEGATPLIKIQDRLEDNANVVLAHSSASRQKDGSCYMFSIKDCHYALKMPPLSSFPLQKSETYDTLVQFHLPEFFLKTTQFENNLPSTIRGKYETRIHPSSPEQKFKNYSIQHFEAKYIGYLRQLERQGNINALMRDSLKRRNAENLFDIDFLHSLAKPDLLSSTSAPPSLASASPIENAAAPPPSSIPASNPLTAPPGPNMDIGAYSNTSALREEYLLSQMNMKQNIKTTNIIASLRQLMMLLDKLHFIYSFPYQGINLNTHLQEIAGLYSAYRNILSDPHIMGLNPNILLTTLAQYEKIWVHLIDSQLLICLRMAYQAHLFSKEKPPRTG
jgi:hypothetical protein